MLDTYHNYVEDLSVVLGAIGYNVCDLLGIAFREYLPRNLLNILPDSQRSQSAPRFPLYLHRRKHPVHPRQHLVHNLQHGVLRRSLPFHSETSQGHPIQPVPLPCYCCGYGAGDHAGTLADVGPGHGTEWDLWV